MQLKTILNRVERYKSFVYGRVSWMDDPSDLKLRVEIAPRANSRPVCSGCEHVGSTYDHLPERTFEFVPCSINVYFRFIAMGSSILCA